jgi:hypothetical protein
VGAAAGEIAMTTGAGKGKEDPVAKPEEPAGGDVRYDTYLQLDKLLDAQRPLQHSRSRRGRNCRR